MALMTIQQCFEILDLKQDATLDDARQAYKDIVNVWHPDRFSANPRLKHKAEEKLKEINVAYETVVKAFFQQGESSNSEQGEGVNTAYHTHQRNREMGEQTIQTRSRTEIAAEVGTSLILHLYSYVSAKLHLFMEKDRS